MMYARRSGMARSETVPLPWPLDVFVERPGVAGVVGALAALASVVGLAFAVREYRRFPAEPAVVEAQQAAERARSGALAFVTIHDLALVCGAGGETDRDIVARSPTGRPVLVSFDGVTSCRDRDARPLTGVLREATESGKAHAIKRGMDLSQRPADEPLLLLCTYCGSGNATIGAAVSLFGLVVGLLMYPLSRLLRRHYLGVESDG